ncbi:helix-turn-helix transcriptional regulator [Paracoccus sp. (in: a-proteobacteria)]|uniref:helix-turn-helix transcriptional regulator n=1 Tax=Paracoccus sp. TaxID=267 RepID=UPI0026E0BC70|nr:helix-turn-helix transcriptional regulator [Paracoccus sp. (in: a-proteobacteria)]MDO5648067.1 short-chain fatty acyl-CoA regulator family protein [Paracoccus sp. (in: a-proteobacteria)]
MGDLTGTRIRERRMLLGRRQADVARDAGISPAYLNLIEHNRRAVGADLIDRLAQALDVPPDELAEGRAEARISALREAAATLPHVAPELDQVAEFLARFPGWAELLIAGARRAGGLERQLVNLSDRMTQDPHLLATLHEVLSAVTAIRSTAAILHQEPDVPADWRARFHENLHQDSGRLTTTAQALVAYLEGFETDTTISTPQEEVEAWLNAGSPPVEDAPDLVSDAGRALAADVAARMAADRDALPDAQLHDAAELGDPLRIAAAVGQPLDRVLRRLAVLRPAGFDAAGLLVCDGSGALTLRLAAAGFALPRPGDGCALWPIYQALAQPHVAISRDLVTPEGRRFRSISLATRHQPLGLDGPVLTQAQMLLVPVPPGAGAATPIGPACRICPRGGCPARREPSILSTGPRGF